jgi:tetratricopeptide (TPR) repeat protein
MSTTWLAITALAAGTAAALHRYRHAWHGAHEATPARRGIVHRERARAFSPPPREMPSFEWEAPLPAAEPRAAEDAVLRTSDEELREAQRARIRDRYVAARFPGVARNARDLADTERVVRYARIYFEERKLDRALELLELALECDPANEALRLARLEIVFLAGEAALYVALANEFRIAHPESGQWGEVARLGREIAPDEAAFGAREPASRRRCVPNWTGASLDFTPDQRAEEFHRAMAQRAALEAFATKKG